MDKAWAEWLAEKEQAGLGQIFESGNLEQNAKLV